MTNNCHIEVRDLKVSYEDLEVIQGISFEVRRGEFVSIIGKTGCGKSSLLHALAGFIDKKGEITVSGNAGIVFQAYAIFPWLTVEQNIAFGLGKFSNVRRTELVSQHLEMTGLMNEASKYPFQLSGGQSQRVALARALAPNPDVILMDEPFGALDEFTREKMQAWLLDIWEKTHKTVVFVTHNLEEAIFLSDRVMALGHGKILGEFAVPFERPREEKVKFSGEFVTLKEKMLEMLENC